MTREAEPPVAVGAIDDVEGPRGTRHPTRRPTTHADRTYARYTVLGARCERDPSARPLPLRASTARVPVAIDAESSFRAVVAAQLAVSSQAPSDGEVATPKAPRPPALALSQYLPPVEAVGATEERAPGATAVPEPELRHRAAVGARRPDRAHSVQDTGQLVRLSPALGARLFTHALARFESRGPGVGAAARPQEDSREERGSRSSSQRPRARPRCVPVTRCWRRWLVHARRESPVELSHKDTKVEASDTALGRVAASPALTRPPAQRRRAPGPSPRDTGSVGARGCDARLERSGRLTTDRVSRSGQPRGRC